MSNTSEPIISCHVHDYFEAACVERSKVCLTLRSGEKIVGIADDLLTRDKREILVIKCKNSSELVRKEISLLDILEMEFLDDAQFQYKTIRL